MSVIIHKGPLNPTLTKPGCPTCLAGKGAPLCSGCHQPFTLSTALHELSFCSMACERTTASTHRYGSTGGRYGIRH